eukprot:GILI01007835.1.p1 GENE.GILI01007835.1~~GILI01007835.1.p1  ORF type:complete len:417 (+),score=78.65 GILI01007835.1:107-1357(+)
MFGIRFDEIIAMWKVKQRMVKKIDVPANQEDLAFCFDILPHVSRSFAAVIGHLREELRTVMCIFYLVLRALDTIEDDMDIPVADKLANLPVFHTHLQDSEWFVGGIGKGKERTLLEQFDRVSREYQKLKPAYQEVISDITSKMAEGMCHFLQNNVQDTKDYDLYCHYVAGIVGHGLTRIFASSGLEDEHLADDLEIANSMGLFLQKGNIIRDYFEDVLEDPPRLFWPKDIWGHFGTSIFDFRDRANEAHGRECLNAMICDALRHIPHCIQYLSSLKETTIFQFCAVPQVMTMATFTILYNNYETFHTKQKIRKGLTCKIMLTCDSLAPTLDMFSELLRQLEKALVPEDPSYELTLSHIKKAYLAIAKHRPDAGKLVARESFTRGLLSAFPALGGSILLLFADSITGYFHRADAGEE